MSGYSICKRCVMDNTAVEFEKFEDGTCNFCRSYFDNQKKIDDDALHKMIVEIKSKKAGEYDCVIGVSGGVDSTYVAYKVKELGLNPIAVHLDNGWNSELAVANIKKTLDKLEIPLYTYVLNWKEFREIQLSFLRASIPGMEIPTDHAITALLYRSAEKFGVKYIINGSNYRMEKIMPRSWSEFEGQMDWYLIKSVHKIFSGRKIHDFMRFSLFDMIFWRAMKKIRVFNILDYIDFDKDEAMETIQQKLGWVYYGGKHYESIYTRFTQAYIQPRKFNIDKRKAHYSNLICAGMMSRDAALANLALPAYPSEEMMQRDLEFFKKKLGITDKDFDEIIKLDTKSFRAYPNKKDHWVLSFIEKLALDVNLKLKRFRG